MAEKTDNHGLNKYSSGDTDWTHSPDMQHIEERLVVRDAEANLSNYTSHAKATFVATDTGAVYDGDGASWNQATREFNSISAETLSQVPTESESQSVFANISNGQAVAVSQEGTKSVDPTNYTTDDAALQVLVDWAEANTNSVVIYCPHLRPDGSAYTITSTVSTSDDSSVTVSWQFLGSGESQPNATQRIKTTITDGSPMFRVSGNIMAQQSGTEDHQHSAFFDGLSVNVGGNNAGIIEFAHGGSRITNIDFMAVNGDAIRVVGQAFQGQIDGINGSGGGGDSARGIVFDSGDTGIGTDWIVGPHITLAGGWRVCLTDSGSNFGRNVVGGYYEGASGRANIDLSGSSKWFITPSTYSTFSRNGAHGIYADGGIKIICPSEASDNDGDGLHIGPNSGQFRIWQYSDYQRNTGDAIYIESTPTGPNKAIVPYENTINGTVSYPPDPWIRLFYPDGWQRYRTFQDVTLESGGTVTLASYAGRTDTEFTVDVFPDSEPDGNVGWRLKSVWNNTNGQVDIIATETESTGESIDLGGIVYRRGQRINNR